MEKLSDADLIAAVKICCGPPDDMDCDGCLARNWCAETHTDIMCELERRLSDLRSRLDMAKAGRLELARQYQALRAERDDLRKDIEVLLESRSSGDLISRRALLKEIDGSKAWVGFPMATKMIALELTCAAPAVEAEPVVHCKDCWKWYPNDGSGCKCRYCGYPDPDDYCSEGERRSEDA